MLPKQANKKSKASPFSSHIQDVPLFALGLAESDLKSDRLPRQGAGQNRSSPSICGADRHYRFTVLELPVSANRYWRVAGNRIYVSREAEAFKKVVAWEAKRAGVTCISDQPVEVKIYYYHEFPKRRLDVDNILKCAIDSLSGVAFDNDKRVVKVTAECWHDADHPRLTFEITYRGMEDALAAMEEER